MSLSKTFSALSDPSRRKILDLLKSNDMSVGELAKHFNIAGASLSHHLSILKNSQLILSNRKGQSIIYSINLSAFEETTKEIINFLTHKNHEKPNQTKR